MAVMDPDRSVSTEMNNARILRIRKKNKELSDRACSSSNAMRQKCVHPTYCGLTSGVREAPGGAEPLKP